MPPYSTLLVAGLAVSLVIWSGLAHRDPLAAYSAAASVRLRKVVYLLAEGWMPLGDAGTTLVVSVDGSVSGTLV